MRLASASSARRTAARAVECTELSASPSSRESLRRLQCQGRLPRFAREKNCDLRLLDFETFGGFGNGVRKILRQAADQLSNKLSHAQHLDEVTWTTKNWHGLQMQRLSVVLHTAVAWQTVNELACGDSGIVHGAKCIAVLNGVA
ncbi:hypothetical protein EMIHUDRAFT_233419 [Emiliania huxleyi CCMP1516]|uniref:Uncharacterized protein n=2 Tax=Emiliania huxleyi TaxID=2903 RepID=A0A0D3K269_EMIH1|nr:hypothetical protein EMIHUDRAFT_233419 [Emiliania huxleyi CCMP1516]EOD29854.1 hypothetical protein EMIHUDRAFT_233419 [Emiliania huxleyi CCMP1516]|eukprot:XP_005782283.1 hypothetical protein EMIHUDRAFT_233419 [Emiliania huxleyi CCMP1516]